MAGILCLNGFLGMGITMTNESLEQRIAKQEERLKQQEERLKQLKAQKQAKDAREKAKQKVQERKNDTRRKILLGAWVLNKIKNDESFKHQLADFEQFLATESKTEENRKKDKELFTGILIKI